MPSGNLEIRLAEIVDIDIEMAVEIAPREPNTHSEIFSVSFIKFSVVRHVQSSILQQPEVEKWTQQEILLLSTELLLTNKEKSNSFLGN